MTQGLLKPTTYAEKKIINDILNNTYAPGDTLPAERILAQSLGVTRPTLREVLQRLSKEGWVIIRHGKPTQVNHYLENGGLAILGALARNGHDLPPDMVVHLLEVRAAILPDIALKASKKGGPALRAYLKEAGSLTPSPTSLTDYDWQLQMLMVKLCGNPVFKMMFNDFAPAYRVLGRNYFKDKAARALTLRYYENLINALERDTGDIKEIVERMMKKTRETWQSLQ